MGGYGYGAHRGRGAEGGLSPALAQAMEVGAIDIDIKPGKAEVWVDGEYYGLARDFDGSPSYLWLKRGKHTVSVYKGGYETFEETLGVNPGVVSRVKLKLLPGDSRPPGND